MASGTPDAVAPTGGANVIGRKYKDIVQDMADGYAYGQTDSGTWMGGWGYTWNAGSSDNSVNQWAAIGLLGGESVISNGPDGIPHTADDVTWAVVPAFVKTANRNSLTNTQATTANCGAANDGAFALHEQQLLLPLGTVRDHAGGHGADGPGWHRAGQRAVGQDRELHPDELLLLQQCLFLIAPAVLLRPVLLHQGDAAHAGRRHPVPGEPARRRQSHRLVRGPGQRRRPLQRRGPHAPE
ncbi:MAG: hypothetical protein MZW92_53325 [Comamonadaceae bacterium]|nr:hypothetical protein [Comamonadaceae bacterium]